MNDCVATCANISLNDLVALMHQSHDCESFRKINQEMTQYNHSIQEGIKMSYRSLVPELS